MAKAAAITNARLANRLRANGSRADVQLWRGGCHASNRIAVGVKIGLMPVTSVLSWPSVGPGGDVRDGGVARHRGDTRVWSRDYLGMRRLRELVEEERQLRA